jgi:CTP:molybdopterin cytidylyltransferase MocA
MRTAMRTAAIIPVAGISSRMGDFKPLMEVNGFALVRMTAQSALDGGVCAVCVVLGKQASSVEDALRGLTDEEAYPEGEACFPTALYGALAPGGARVVFVHNHDFMTTDMLRSIQLGLQRLLEDEGEDGAGRLDAVLILPGDMPGVSPGTIGALRTQAAHDGASVLYPQCPQGRGHPILVKRECFEAIRGFEGDGGLKAALLGYERGAVDVDDEGILLDADDPASFAQLEAFVRRTKGISEALVDGFLDRCGTLPHIRDHCKAVGKMAAWMARALDRRGLCLDTELCRSAAGLHDMERLEKDHPRVAEKRLRADGYEAVAAIVAKHDGYPELNALPSAKTPLAEVTITEAGIVGLADKLIQETRPVTLDVRYQKALTRFPETTEIGQHIRRDKEAYERLLARVAAELERTPGS